MYEYEKLCAARQMLVDLEGIQRWMYFRRRALLDDLVALEREQDERIMVQRRKRLKQIRWREAAERKRFDAMARRDAERRQRAA